MARTSDLEKARKVITDFFIAGNSKVYRQIDLRSIFDNHKEEWNLGKSTRLERFIDFSSEVIPLQQVHLRFPKRHELRYVCGMLSIYSVVQSLKAEGYFSHRSAAEFHGLLEPDNQIFFNFEQSLRSQSSGEMTQDAIDRAFQNKPRLTLNKANWNEYTIWMLNGKNTGCYGVTQYHRANNELLRITDPARTLIDIAVRPGYCGGPIQVLEAYRKGLEIVDGSLLAKTLAALKHNYPYHQVVGWYMEKAGFSKTDLEPLQSIPMKFDFYLDYRIVEARYSQTWRLYYPVIMDHKKQQ